MNPPRRIFRSSMAFRSARVGRTLALWSGAVIGTAGLVMVGQSSDLFGRASAGPERVQAGAAQVAVIDGETLMLNGQVVRLTGVRAPPRGEACNGGADCGGAAGAALAGLVRDRRVDCRLSGHDQLGRPYGRCEVDGTDLSQAIVVSGWARAAGPELDPFEATARSRRAGLWAAAYR